MSIVGCEIRRHQVRVTTKISLGKYQRKYGELQMISVLKWDCIVSDRA